MFTPEEMELLESSLLPALERHHLRLLAHGLRTLQGIAASSTDPQRLPDRAQMEAWAAAQSSLAEDPAFQKVFLEQLARLLIPLEEIASQAGQPLLNLELPQLVSWAKEQADARLSPPGPPPG